MKKRNTNTLLQMLAMILVAALFASGINLIRPNGIAWIQDWGSYVETRARKEGISVIPLSVAYSFHKTQKCLFVDARSSTAYDKGHISKAISLPFGHVDEQFESLTQILSSKIPVVLYCRNRECDDALQLALELQQVGILNLLYYVDGFELWEEENCPIEITHS